MELQNYSENERILLSLVAAENEDKVTEILKDSFFKKVKWKPLGGDQSNYSTVAAQQSDSINALCEKPINSIDHLLIKKCKMAGIDPESSVAPQSMKAAIEQFFHIKDGDLTKLKEEQINELSENIMIIADGNHKRPNLIIADRGEGQRPEDFDDTLLSLHKGNKVRIKFVQGKYNMGGTGALPFSGKLGYQLILSRKSIDLNGANSEWGFTLIREKPDVPESFKTTWYEYFVDENDSIFKISGKPLNILPEKKEYLDGTLIKLFDYDLPHASIVTARLWRDLNTKLFYPALPVTVYENRSELTKSSWSKYARVLGNGNRVQQKQKNIYKTIRINSSLQGFGNNKIEITIFKHANKTENKMNNIIEFRDKDEAVFITQNGQTHFNIGESTFKTKTGLASITSYVMVHVDLSDIDRNKSKIFMASRDRARDSEDYKIFVKRIFEDISENEQMKDLNRQYTKFDEENIVTDSSLEDTIQSLIKDNPTLWNLFMQGDTVVLNEEKGFKDSKAFSSQYIPTYLLVRGTKENLEHEKQIPMDGTPTYIQFKTDAPNDYLDRETDSGELLVEWPEELEGSNHGLYNGLIAIKLRKICNAIPGDKIGMLKVKLTRPNNDPLSCNVNLYYGITKRGNSKEKPDRKKRAFSFPKLDKVYKDRWNELGWNERDIVKVDPETIHLNLESKYLEDVKRRVSSEQYTELIPKYLLSMYFQSVLIDNELKDEENYDDIFKKSMIGAAKSVLLLIRNKNNFQIESLLGLNTIKSAIAESRSSELSMNNYEQINK